MASLSEAPSTSHWLYFVAGALLPTIAYSLRKSGKKSTNNRNDADKDEDLDGVETTGPSSQWGLMQGPYKVSIVLLISFLTMLLLHVHSQNDDLTFTGLFLSLDSATRHIDAIDCEYRVKHGKGKDCSTMLSCGSWLL